LYIGKQSEMRDFLMFSECYSLCLKDLVVCNSDGTVFVISLRQKVKENGFSSHIVDKFRLRLESLRRRKIKKQILITQHLHRGHTLSNGIY
jgi:hypothetical protein